MKKLLKNLIHLTVLSTLIILPSSYLSADENDLVIVDMISSKTIPGSTVVPIEIKVEHQDSSLKQFLNVGLEMRWNSGVVQNYTMKDDGISGDKVEGDNIYTALISADSSLGENVALVKVGWKNSEIEYPVEFKINTQQFPKMFLMSNLDIVGSDNMENVVGFVRTEVNGIPYEVGSDDLNINLTDKDGFNREIIITSKNKIGNNNDYEFFISTKEYIEEEFNLSANLSIEFLGDIYDSPVQQVTVIRPKSNFWTIFYISISIIAFFIILISFYLLKKWNDKVKPHGFLLDSGRNFIIDFSEVEKSLFSKIFNKNSLLPSELKKYNFGNFKLEFFKNYIVINSLNANHTVRVDGKPISGSYVIKNESSVGFEGKLFIVCCKENQLVFPVNNAASELA
ncbi:MAG: choice-of-anchor X domain-containing protein [Chloroflexota bacterium]|nr:choice-of-anchor X domain-containing protein [Chloroflexota bacterium]